MSKYSIIYDWTEEPDGSDKTRPLGPAQIPGGSAIVQNLPVIKVIDNETQTFVSDPKILSVALRRQDTSVAGVGFNGLITQEELDSWGPAGNDGTHLLLPMLYPPPVGGGFDEITSWLSNVNGNDPGGPYDRFPNADVPPDHSSEDAWTEAGYDPESTEATEEEEEEEETTILGEKELSPIDELAKKILSGELDQFSFLGPQGQHQTSPAGGSLTTAPLRASSPAQAKTAPIQRTAMTQGGYAPSVPQSLLKGVPVPQTYQVPSDDSSTHVDVDNDPDTPDVPFFNNDPSDPSVYPWHEWLGGGTWGMSEDERELAAKEQVFLGNWGDHVGEPYRIPKELVEVDESAYWLLHQNLHGLGFDQATRDQIAYVDNETGKLFFKPLEAYYILQEHPDSLAFITNNPDWNELNPRFEGLPDYAKSPDGTVINPFVGNWEGNEDTPWSDLRNLENNGVTAPPWHENHDSRLDMFGRPAEEGGLTWDYFLQANDVDPITGIPFGDPDDFEWTRPLDERSTDPDFLKLGGWGGKVIDPDIPTAGTDPDVTPLMVDEPIRPNIPYPGSDPTVVPLMNEVPQDEFGDQVRLASEQEEVEEQPGSVQQVADALSQAGFEQGSLPPMSYGSGKGSPSQQLMPEQIVPEDYAAGGMATPLSGALSTPVENLEPPSRRSLFPGTNAFYR